jgi:uncharacterized membrane protein YfcA
MRRLIRTRTIGIGIATGVLSGLFGIGGGILMVPALVLLGGMPQRRAHATSLAAIIPIAAFASIPFFVRRLVDPHVGIALAVGGLTGAVLGARLLRTQSDQRLRVGFGLLLATATAQMLVGSPSATSAPPMPTFAAAVPVGVLAGITSALFGVGGGIVMVPAMVLLMGISQHAAQGTSLAAIIPTALVGSHSHRRADLLDLPTAATLGVSGVLGATAGSVLALQLPATSLRQAFAVLMGAVVIVFIRRTAGERRLAR